MNARLESLRDQLDTRRRELEVLKDLGAALSSTPDLDTLAGHIYEQSGRIMNTINFFLALHDPARNLISFPLRVESRVRLPYLAPRPYAYFLAKRTVFWALAAISVLLGAVSVAVLIFAVTDYLQRIGVRGQPVVRSPQLNAVEREEVANFPGFRLMAEVLHDHTALLPLVHIEEPNPPVPGTDTPAAICAGVYWAVTGGVKALIRQLTGQAGSRRGKVFITGGDAHLLLAVLEPDIEYCPTLTLEGVRIAAEALPEEQAKP